MLQALIKHKLKEAFRDSSFEPSEDSKTSSVFGLLQYLPAQTMWNLLRESCGNNTSLMNNLDSGELQSIQFWPRWSAEGNEISNSKYVEPDVFCEFDNFDLIVEAKKDDYSGQNEQQWKKEIKAYFNEYPYSGKELIFIAFGGNETLKTKSITVNGQDYTVFSASWQNLINAIDKYKKECSNNTEKRMLSDIVLAFEKHNFFSMEWLETLSKKHISQECIKNIDFWMFSNIVPIKEELNNTNFLNDIYYNNNSNINSNSKNIFALWQTH